MTSQEKKGNKPEILVVEDSRTQAELLRYLLEEHGYAVTTAADGKQAFSRVREVKPALIISDIVMPEMDGYELCQNIKSDPGLRDIPVILLTQLSSPAVIIKGLQCEADNFIIKPYDGAYLLSRIAHMLTPAEKEKNRKTGKGVDVFFAGKEYSISSERQQILDLFLSTYEKAVQWDMDVVRKRDKLEDMNEKLEELVEQRTWTLIQEIEGHKEAEKALRESEKRLKHLSSQLLTAQEAERRRIAGELHDSVAASLSAIRYNIEKIFGQMEPNELTRAGSRELGFKVQQVMEETRRIMSNLRPAVLDDLGLIPAINWFHREFQKTYSGVSVEKEIDIKENEIPDSLRTPIFRILQEALNNIAKHSKATFVHLSLQKSDGRIELDIRDNGQGFDIDAKAPAGDPRSGLGLVSMRERAELSGGSLDIESSEGKGTTIRASWPQAENQ